MLNYLFYDNFSIEKFCKNLRVLEADIDKIENNELLDIEEIKDKTKKATFLFIVEIKDELKNKLLFLTAAK